MKSPLLTRLAFCIALTVASGKSSAELKMPPVFADNMVLQRETSAPIWGTADYGEAVTVTLDDQKIAATADKDGKWRADFHGLKPGSPFTLTVAGKSNTLTFKNVAVGDIWVCSGQSNMEYPLGRDAAAAVNDPDLRYFASGYRPSADPAPDAKPGYTLIWVQASPKEAAGRTAVGYYFAKNLRKELGIPIGLIQSGCSGTRAEPWTPMDAIDTIPELSGPARQLIQSLRDLPSDAAKLPALYQQWQEKNGRLDPENKGFPAGWADPKFDTRDWVVTTTRDWGKLGIRNGGVVWVRKTVQFPPEAANKDFNIFLGRTQADTVYFNGEQVQVRNLNTTQPPYYWRNPQEFRMPGRLVRAGENVLAVRMVCQTQNRPDIVCAGFPVSDPGTLSENWQAKVEMEFPPLPPEGLATMPSVSTVVGEATPSALFNGKIVPLIPYGIKGAIWYQGESGPGGAMYRAVLPALIKGWRAHWGQGDFPFYIVQLPNLGAAPKLPGEGDDWTEVREAQLLTSQSVVNTGLAVTIDIGDPANLHPPNKQDVGYRLALNALAQTYGLKMEFSGPIYDSMAVEGHKIRLKFTHVGGGLVAKDGALKQFIITGEDKKWAWADAVIEGDTVVVSSPQVATPAAVRYAWAKNPEGCNLYNKGGLPASPFRTDH